MFLMMTLTLSSVLAASPQPAQKATTGFRLETTTNASHLAASLSHLRVAPAAFQDDMDSSQGSDPNMDLSASSDPMNQSSSTSDSIDGGSEAVPVFGAEGSMRWTIHGGWGIDVHGSNQEIQGGVGMQYFIVDGFAFAPEVNLWGFFQTGPDAFGGSLDLMFEWHFIRQTTWSLYGDFGIGLLGTTANVPYNGSEFNFTPQAGLGVTFDIGNNNRWYAGVRWHHISNASLYEDNPGRDSILLYTGINFPF
tara:strand:- start:69700 stop:70449 length:750 start_codon:yes stop_codon:yes gene_type:complete